MKKSSNVRKTRGVKIGLTIARFDDYQKNKIVNAANNKKPSSPKENEKSTIKGSSSIKN